METKEERFSPAEMGKLMFENFGDYKNVLKTLSEEYIEKEGEEKNDVVVISTIPTDVFIEDTCIEVEKCATLLEDIPMNVPIPETYVKDVPIQTQLSRVGSYYNREYELIRDKIQGANTDEKKYSANVKLLEFKSKLKYDAFYAKTETEKGYAIEMQKQLELLENKIEYIYKPESMSSEKPVIQSEHLDKFEKIYQKVVDAKTEKEKGCADVELINFRTHLQIDAQDGKTEQAKSSAQEMLKRVELLKTLSEQKIAETGFNGAFGPSNPKKTFKQLQEERKDDLNIKKTYGVDAYGDNGLDSLDGMLCGISSKYEEIK